MQRGRSSTDIWTEADSDLKGQKQQEQHLQALVLGRLGSPSVRTPWTSCPVTWLFGVETGGRLRRPGEELWGLHWGGPVAESSRQSVLSTWAGSKDSSCQSCGRVRTVETLFPSEEAFAGREQEPAGRLL